MAGEGSSQRAVPEEPRYNSRGALLCHAHSQSSGKRCGVPAMKGQKVCRFHGGMSPQAKRGVERRKLMEEVNEQAQRLQLTGPGEIFKSPQDAIKGLYRAADRSEWMLEVLTKKIQALNDVRYRSESEQLRGEAILWDQTMGKHVHTLSTIIKLALTERQLELDAAVGRLVVSVITRSLRAGGVEGQALERAQREAHRLLRLEWREESPPELPPGTG